MTIRGIVVRGRSLGHTLGFPTANIAIPEDLLLDNGVYLSRVGIGTNQYRAITNIGTRPSVGGGERNIESHILDFSGDIYGCEIEVELLEKLRDEVHFATIEELSAQVQKDIEKAKTINR